LNSDLEVQDTELFGKLMELLEIYKNRVFDIKNEHHTTN